MANSNVSVHATIESESEEFPRGLRNRILLSIIVPITWLCLTLLYVGFWASGFTLFQSVILVLVSLLILGGTLGSIWTYWGPKYQSKPGPH